MNASQFHRGPDEGGFYIELGLAHRVPGRFTHLQHCSQLSGEHDPLFSQHLDQQDQGQANQAVWVTSL